MAAQAKVTDLEHIRAVAEERALYRTAQGHPKETYLALPYTLLSRLFDLPLAETRMLLYVWQRTGGWREYNAHPAPARITFSEWTRGRPNYPQDTGAHLCTQEVSTTRDALIARGWLYEEWETPYVRGPRRYALIAPENPGVGPYQTSEEGIWEVLLLTRQGNQPYQIPATLLQHRTGGAVLLQHRTDSLLQDRKGSSTAQKSPFIQYRKEKSRHAFPAQGQRQPIDNSLDTIPTKDLEREAAGAASHPPVDSREEMLWQEKPLSGLAAPTSPNSSVGSEERGKPTAEFPASSQMAFLPAGALAAPSESPAASQKRGVRSGQRTPSAREQACPPQNALYAVWKQILPPASQRQMKSLCTGLAELSNPTLTEGQPVAPEELPGLLYQVMDEWVDRRRGEHYTPTPRLIAEWLGTIRRQVRERPSSRVRAWQAGELPWLLSASATETAEREEPLETQAEPLARPSDPPSGTPLDPLTVLDEDPEWAARLSRFVPDGEDGPAPCPFRDVQMLWGFVRDALRPGLNTARRQHLDALTPVWDPANPRELLLLSSTSYTVRFINMTLLREIDGMIGKLLIRFFDQARLEYVPQQVIDQVVQQSWEAARFSDP